MNFCCCENSPSGDAAVVPVDNVDSEHAAAMSAVLELAASAAPQFITVQIADEQSVGKLAIETADMENGPLISKVSSDAAFDAMPEPFDRIVMVNGTRGKTASLLEQMQTSPKNGKLTLTLQRPVVRKVVLHKPGALGITLSYKKSSMGIVVKDVHTEGLIAIWNAANPDLEVACGDRIAAVNNVQKPVSQDLFEEMKTAERLEMTIYHYES